MKSALHDVDYNNGQNVEVHHNGEYLDFHNGQNEVLQLRNSKELPIIT